MMQITNIYFYVIGLFFLLPGIYIVIPHIIKLILRKRSFKNIDIKKDIILSFDDGPDPKSTNRILDELENKNATAIFFVTGENASNHPEIIERIIQGGHLIGSHGYSHLHPWKTGPIKIVKDWYKEHQYFSSMKSKYINNISFYRPPYGKFNIIQLVMLLFSSRRLMFWNIDPKDYNHLDHEVIINELQNKKISGKIILFHDGRYKKNSDARVTTNAIKELLKQDGFYSIRTIK